MTGNTNLYSRASFIVHSTVIKNIALLNTQEKQNLQLANTLSMCLPLSLQKAFQMFAGVVMCLELSMLRNTSLDSDPKSVRIMFGNSKGQRTKGTVIQNLDKQL